MTPPPPFARGLALLIDIGLLGNLMLLVWASLLFAPPTLSHAPGSLCLPLLSLAPLVAMGYFVLMRAGGGQTVGERIMRIRLITADQRRPGAGDIFLRAVCLLAATMAVGVGPTWSLLFPADPPWHELLSETRLITTETA